MPTDDEIGQATERLFYDSRLELVVAGEVMQVWRPPTRLHEFSVKARQIGPEFILIELVRVSEGGHRSVLLQNMTNSRHGYTWRADLGMPIVLEEKI